jgi:hypothetical protein
MIFHDDYDGGGGGLLIARASVVPSFRPASQAAAAAGNPSRMFQCLVLIVFGTCCRTVLVGTGLCRYVLLVSC